jgi:L-fuculose-phosphate aldolase
MAASVVAAIREPVPPVHYALAKAGGEVPVAEYAMYGSPELAGHAAQALDAAGTTACLLANHGLIASGGDLESAFETLDAVEFTARIAVQATAAGEPVALSVAELDRVADKLETYGQPSSDGG